MFQKEELKELQSWNSNKYKVLWANGHDVHIHSQLTGHDWIIQSNYADMQCIIMHRHSDRYPYHRQHGHYASIWDAIEYIRQHDESYYKHHMKSKKNQSRHESASIHSRKQC